MPTITELRTQREKLLVDSRAILSAENVSTEQRVNAEHMLGDAEALRSRIDSLASIETELAPGSQRRNGTTAPAAFVADTRSRDERRAATNAALRNYLLRGGDRSAIESRDLTIAADGSAIIPTGILQPVVAQQSSGSIYDIVRKLRTTTGEPVTVPLFNDLANSWVLNSTAISTTDPSINGVPTAVDQIRRNPVLIDNSLLQDTNIDLVQMVEDGFDLTYRLTVSKWITLGNTSNVKSLVTSNTTSVMTATTATLAYKDLTAALAALDPAYQIGACWSFSNATLATTILNIQDGNQRPIFLPLLDGGNSGFSGTIFGFPVKLNPYLAAVATGNVAAQFGNFAQAYTLREVDPGIRIEQSAIPYMTTDKLAIVAFARVGGIFTDAGTHPMVNIAIK